MLKDLSDNRVRKGGKLVPTRKAAKILINGTGKANNAQFSQCYLDEPVTISSGLRRSSLMIPPKNVVNDGPTIWYQCSQGNQSSDTKDAHGKPPKKRVSGKWKEDFAKRRLSAKMI